MDVILESSLFPLLGDLIVDFSGTKNQSLYVFLLRWEGQPRCYAFIHNQSSKSNSLEVVVVVHLIIEICQRRLAQRMSQQVLWGHDDQWFSELTVNLPPETMEEIGWSCDVDHSPVMQLMLRDGVLSSEEQFWVRVDHSLWDDMRIIVTHLQESLQPRTAMLWTLAIVSVGQLHYKTRLPQPLGLPTRQELVEHWLRAIRKITKLSLPDHKGVRILH